MSGQVSVPIESLRAAPRIMWNHIDGPLLIWACFEDWLTWGERVRLWLGLTDIERLAQKRWPIRKRWVGR